jgi:hypothetical protein
VAGKKKIPGVKKDNRGGKRAGSGQKPKEPKQFSRDVKAKYIQAAEKLAKEYGYGIEECILRLLYGEEIQDSVKVGIVKLYNEVLVIRESSSTVTHKGESKPEIYLPKSKPDPAKIIPIDGGKK